jgi:hypothetical protein
MKKVIYICDLTGKSNLSEVDVHHFKKAATTVTRSTLGDIQEYSIELSDPKDSNLHIDKKVCSNLNNLFKILTTSEKPK